MNVQGFGRKWSWSVCVLSLNLPKGTEEEDENGSQSGQNHGVGFNESVSGRGEIRIFW
jgi:hypothetical protein